MDEPPSARPADQLENGWPLPGSEDLRDALLEAYGHRSRGYHDTRHLGEVLDRVDELAEAGARVDRLPVLLAAWFHDAVYDGERDAEERSALWAETALVGRVDAETVAETARLVRLTETHEPEADDRNGCTLSDADLAILAAPPARYAEYVAQVRREFAHVPDDAFVAGRTGVLRTLLERPRLFHTAHARAHWEQAARRNVEGELASLVPARGVP